MGLADFLNDEVFGGAKRKRRDEAPAFIKQLTDMGIQDPQTVNAATDEWVRTGKMRLPTTQETRTQVPSYDPMDTLPMTEVDVKPVRLGKRVASQNPDGSFDEAPELQGVSEFLRAPEKKTDGMDYFLDPDTQEVVKAVPNGRAFNQTKVLTRKPGTGGSGGRAPAETPQQKVARQVLAEYDRALKGGKGIDPELGKRASEAAKFLDLPTETVNVPGEKHWFSKDTPDSSYERPSFGKKTDFQTEADALASGLPEGTIITIGGKRFRLAR